MRAVFLIFSFFFLFSACKKYDEDEFVSLRKPEKRLKIWSPFNSTKVTYNEIDLDWEVSLGFQKDDEFRRRLTDENGDEFESEGDWELSDDEEHVILNHNNGGRERWRIEKLHRKELVMEITDQQGGTLRFEMEGH